MKYLSVLLILVSLNFNLFAQTNYYVNQQSGSNSNDGLTTSTPFETFDFALGNLTEGDTLQIMGEYSNDSYNSTFTFTNDHDPHLWHAENTIRINGLNGSPGNYYTIKAYDENTILKGDGANIFRVTNSSYLKIMDFKIQGEVDNILNTTAEALQFVYIDANTVVDEFDPTAAEIRYRDQDCVSNCVAGQVLETEIYSDLSGLSVKRPSYTDTRGLYLSNVDHIDIINNTIYKTPGGGLRVSDCEDINIIGNEVHNCSRKSYSGTHALVVTKATSTRTTDDYRINILRNKVHHNYNEIYSWAPTKTIITPHIDEGKGISLQRNQTTYNNDGTINVNWENGKILIANNICYYNGFSGVHSNDGNRIDMINNTCYFNSYTKSITEAPATGNGGNIGISAQGGSNIRMINNISIIDSDLNKSALASNLSAADGLVVRDNLIYGTTGAISEDADIVAVQVNTQMVDPLFVDASSFDFNLQSSSDAIDVMGTTEAPSDDYFEQTRDAIPDLGAIEYFAPLPIELAFFKAILIDDKKVKLQWATLSEKDNAYFIIEKSTNGIDWEELERVSGTGFSNELINYLGFDHEPKNGNNYYRLKQVDFNGKYSYSSIEVIFIKNLEESNFTLFPNPVSNFLYLKSKKPLSDFHFFNAAGIDCTHQLTSKTIAQNYIEINVNMLPNGIYWLKANSMVKQIHILHDN